MLPSSNWSMPAIRANLSSLNNKILKASKTLVVDDHFNKRATSSELEILLLGRFLV